MKRQYFVTGIDTEIGKTVTSAVLVEYLKADYWKPVQAGELDFSDTKKVQSYISNDRSVFHPETYRLNTPASPHLAAEIDDIEISLDDFQLPQTDNDLIVEGAGGLMVPLNYKHMVIDLIKKLELEVILVTKHYLGSINHTILSIKALQNLNIPIAGLIVNGAPNESSESAIIKLTGVQIIGRVPEMEMVDQKNVANAAKTLSL